MTDPERGESPPLQGGEDVNGNLDAPLAAWSAEDLFPPRYLHRYARRLARVVQSSPVKIFLASYIAHPWPFRLQHVGESAPTSFRSSPYRILDSGFETPAATNESVYARAKELGATAVVAKDYPGESLSKTTDSIQAFVEDVFEEADGLVPYFPIQPPYCDHYPAVAEVLDAHDLPHNIMLGGLATGEAATVERRISELLAYREVASTATTHALGWGFDPELVRLLREDPWLLDSVDNSSPGRCLEAQDGLLDKYWTKHGFPHPTGDLASYVTSVLEFYMALQACHVLSPLSGDDLAGAAGKSEAFIRGKRAEYAAKREGQVQTGFGDYSR